MNRRIQVSAPEDLTEEIERLVRERFTEKPFILVWSARSNFAASRLERACK